MKIDCSYDELIEVHKLIAHPKNPNKHPPEQIERLAKIIDYQGQRSPIVVSRLSGFIVAGHGRLEAMKKLGWDRVAVDYQGFESEAQEYAHITADNAIAEWAGLDLGQINQDFLDLGPELDIEMLGIKDFVLEPIEKFEPQCDEDAVPEVVNPITRRGDIWLLGNHRLMCGDSTMIDDVEKLMNGEKTQLTFTSPPYNVGGSVDNKIGKKKMYINSDDDLDKYVDFLKSFSDISLMFSDYVFINIQALSNNIKDIFSFLGERHNHIKDVLIWNKKNYPPNIQKGSFSTKFEFIFCLEKNPKGRNFPCNWQGKFPNVIDLESNLNNQETDTHRAGFPVSLPNWVLTKMDFCKSVYEPFCGTGTTLIACESLSIKNYSMEIDQHYCDVIINRWQNFSGKKATLESTGQTYEELKAERDNG